jgi:hypothetical protein
VCHSEKNCHLTCTPTSKTTHICRSIWMYLSCVHGSSSVTCLLLFIYFWMRHIEKFLGSERVPTYLHTRKSVRSTIEIVCLVSSHTRTPTWRTTKHVSGLVVCVTYMSVRQTLDVKTGLLTGLLTGIQGWKCPVASSQTCYGSKSLKVILMDSNFGGHPVLNPLVTLW